MFFAFPPRLVASSIGERFRDSSPIEEDEILPLLSTNILLIQKTCYLQNGIGENFVLILFLYHKENLADEKSFKASALVHTEYNSRLLFSVRSLGMYTRRFATSIILSTTSA